MGGAERALLEVIDGFKKNGIECYVLLPYNGAISNELNKREISYAIIKFKPWAGEKKKSIIKLIKYEIINMVVLIPAFLKIKRWRCDVVYTNTIMI